MFKYFFPRRKLWLVPKHITAEHDHKSVQQEHALIIMAGLARDELEAERVLVKLRAKYGAEMWQHIKPRVKRDWGLSAGQRWLRLFRRWFGEYQTPNVPDRKSVNEVSDYE